MQIPRIRRRKSREAFCILRSALRGTPGLRMTSMQSARIVAAAALLLLAKPLFAQEWTEYKNNDDRFGVSAPGTPTIEKIKWKSEYESMFPGTVYRWQQG